MRLEAGSGYTVVSSSSVKFYATDAEWADIHYIVNDGGQQNFRMAHQADNTNTHTLNNIPANAKVRYFFTIKPVGGAALDTAWKEVDFGTPPPTAPAVPTGLTATASGTGQIVVTWKAVTGATGYDLKRDGKVVKSVTSPYTHDGLAAGSSHTYSIRAKNAVGNSAYSSQVKATTPAGLLPPTGLTATADSTSQITVRWNAVTGATKYDLERDGVTVSSVTTPYVHSGLAAASTHTYAVRARNSASTSSFSEKVTVKTKSGLPEPPAVPKDLTATANSTSQITITWAPVAGAVGYDLQMDGVTLSSAISPQIHANLAPNSTHTYAVRAKNAAGASAYSAPVTATTKGPEGQIIPLFNASTSLEPATVVVTGTAIITRLGDRGRDRHARESQFKAYDHYLSWYWEHRTVSIEIVDRVAKGGNSITVNITSLWKLDSPDFRAFFRGIGTVAEYWHNADSTATDDYHYTATVNFNPKENRPIKIGDRMEIEFSPFLVNPPNGRSNYYGTAMLYIVGQGGMVPWEAIGDLKDSFPLAQKAWLGGRTTLPYQYSDEPLERLKQMATNMSPKNVQPFMLGRRLHHTNFGDGSHSESNNPVFSEHVGKLGPRFSARSCVECHENNGRTLPSPIGATLKAVVQVGSDAAGTAHPNLGKVLQPQSTAGSPEAGVSISSWTGTTGKFGDGTTFELRKPNYAFTGIAPSFSSVRLAPALVGMGLLEAMDEKTIQDLADPNDANGDGISGRVQTLTDPQTGQLRLGRFGWKAGQARLSHQIASALNQDMGVTTSIAPALDRGSAQPNSSSSIELSDADLDNMVRYVSTLGVPARRNLQDSAALRGETLFSSLSCVKCHTPSVTTSAYHPLTELRSQSIQPYTDMLLHDMGAGLADNMGEGKASGAEWRTPPLWGIGSTAEVNGGEAYLHDGRARNLTEAILWHGGEAQASKEAFRQLPVADRDAVVKFLKSL